MEKMSYCQGCVYKEECKKHVVYKLCFCQINDSRSINPGSNILRITVYVLSVIVVLLTYIKNDCGVGNNIVLVFS
jgi:hypothetical protein